MHPNTGCWICNWPAFSMKKLTHTHLAVTFFILFASPLHIHKVAQDQGQRHHWVNYRRKTVRNCKETKILLWLKSCLLCIWVCLEFVLSEMIASFASISLFQWTEDCNDKKDGSWTSSRGRGSSKPVSVPECLLISPYLPYHPSQAP